MKKRRTHVETAYQRIGILQEVIRRERARAEGNPSDKRNIEIGIVERGSTQKEAEEQVLQCFNDLQVFLDVLKVAHMASCFEAEALLALNLVIDDTRKIIEAGREDADPWPTKLVRERISFTGLHDIEQLLPVSEAQRKTLKKVRDIRNTFAHNGSKIASPEISGDDALPVLLESLAGLV